MKLTLVFLVHLIQEMNHVLDNEVSVGLTISEVESHIEAGDLIPFLRQRLKGKCDLSLFDNEMAEKINEGMAEILDGYKGRERRKWGVQNNGICLVIAWTSEMIQQGNYEEE